jgi:hypothetical protein
MSRETPSPQKTTRSETCGRRLCQYSESFRRGRVVLVVAEAGEPKRFTDDSAADVSGRELPRGSMHSASWRARRGFADPLSHGVGLASQPSRYRASSKPGSSGRTRFSAQPAPAGLPRQSPALTPGRCGAQQRCATHHILVYDPTSVASSGS